MTTVFDVLKKVGEDLPGSYVTGVADSGSTTTIVDASKPGGSSDDIFNDGTALLYFDAAGAGAAPQGQSRIIKDYVGSSGTVILEDPGFTAQVAAGDRYGLIKQRYRRELILDKMNDAFTDIKFEGEDTSLTTVDGDKTYNLPTTPRQVTDKNLLQVHIATRDTDPYNWERVYGYEVDFDGTYHVLRFEHYPISAYKIKLVFWYTHTPVYSDADVIDPRIHVDLISAMTLRRVLEWRYQKFSVPPDRETNALNAALRREAEAKRMYPVMMRKQTPKIPIPAVWTPDMRVPYPPVD